jgi:hypothetical protein
MSLDEAVAFALEPVDVTPNEACYSLGRAAPTLA